MSFDPDDVWVDAIKGLDHLPQAKKRRLYRVAIVAMVGVSYLIDTLLLSLFTLAGTVSAKAPLYYGLAGLGHLLLFSTLHWSGFSERFHNRHMTLWQMAYGIGVQLLGILLAPQLSPFFLGLLFVVFAFGTLRISFRSALVIWLLSMFGTALTMTFKGDAQMTLQNASQLEYLLVTASFALILLRVIVLGYYGQVLRLRLYELGRTFQRDATHDELTGIHNRRGLTGLLAEQLSLRARKAIPCALAMIDIDHFKQINDRFGHAVGDEIIKALVQRLRQELRQSDRLIRYGGEEFLLVMPATRLDEATALSERIRETVGETRWEALPEPRPMTVSVGLTELYPHDQPNEPVQRADAALYLAKRGGRNRVSVLAQEAVGREEVLSVT